ncbi:nucleoside deaminase [Rhizobium herbae]|uniref:tRNA(Arg) A34 adenosine deaminase TadA n=1 Tax=Rhizobium herbae TaxID=508661 RepID=A0ABS4EJ24_9HYPH|nr:nucleoside deaminase [Rhizobium herbae]MBP1857934.1 tRNA(Arg) A34 adenosine deaminase TadA [Rhizobium herbae]
MSDADRFMTEAIALARENVRRGGRPFGAVLVMDGEVVAHGVNGLVETHDPTSHAELLAVRAAAIKRHSPILKGATMYASGHPCPMCLAAMRIAGITDIFYAYSNEDGAPYGLTSAGLYDDLRKPLAEQQMSFAYHPVRPEGEADLYDLWREMQEG